MASDESNEKSYKQFYTRKQDEEEESEVRFINRHEERRQGASRVYLRTKVITITSSHNVRIQYLIVIHYYYYHYHHCLKQGHDLTCPR